MIKILIFSIFFLLITPISNVFATDYNYLPADVLIKQSQEKSALEYRISSLESQMTGSPSLYIGNLDSRIKELERERTTEKNYIDGLYGSYGIGNQLDSKLKEINSKYDDLINDLERQKDAYENEIDRQEEIDDEIEKLQKQLKEFDENYSEKEENDTATEIFNRLDSGGYTYGTLDNLTFLREKNPSLYKEVIQLAENKYYKGKTDPYVMFNYMDNLPKYELDILNNRLGLFNPDLRDKVYKIVLEKYPNGKEFNQVKEVVEPVKTYIEPVKTDIEIYDDLDKKEEDISIKELKKQIKEELKDEVRMEMEMENEEVKKEPKSVFKTFGNFFKKIIFWR